MTAGCEDVSRLDQLASGALYQKVGTLRSSRVYVEGAHGLDVVAKRVKESWKRVSSR